MNPNVRTTTHEDHDAVLGVVRAAFSSPGHDPADEVDIVTRIWALGAAPRGLDMVAVAGDEVVGHVMASAGELSGEEVDGSAVARAALGIAPLGVAPAHQGRGVGTALMDELLTRVEAGGWPFALLLGDPAYYERFGFEPAAHIGISYEPRGPGDPHFMVRRFSAAARHPGALYRYCWETEPGPASQHRPRAHGPDAPARS